MSVSLTGLSHREAITDAIYRAVGGIDMNDIDLFRSTLTEDSVLEINGHALNGWQTIVDDCFNILSVSDTTHMISDVRVQVEEGASTAASTCAVLAQHYEPSTSATEPATRHCLVGTLYNLDLVKNVQDGLWKIKVWKLKTV